MALIQKFQNIINPTGVNTNSTLNLIPENREKIYDGLRSFYSNSIFKIAHPTCQFINGVWGSGKSNIVDNFLPSIFKKGKIRHYRIILEVLYNIYKTQSSQFSNIPGENFLACFLCAISEFNEYENDPLVKKILKLKEKSDGKDWVKKISDYIANIDEKIVVIIDEFENIISLKDEENTKNKKNGRNISKDIILGLKSFLNEDSDIKKLKGSFHLIVNCTPSAFYEIERFPELNEIFGGIERRIKINTLKPISKPDAFKFIVRLLQHSFDQTKFPKEFFEDIDGMINTIARAGIYNFGFMQSLFSRIQTNFDGNQVQSKDLIDFLLKEKFKEITDEYYLKKKFYDSYVQILNDKTQINLFNESLMKLRPLQILNLNSIKNLDVVEKFKTISEINMKIQQKRDIKPFLTVRKILSNDPKIKILKFFEENGDIIYKNGYYLLKFENFEISKSEFLDKFRYNHLNQDYKIEEIYFFPDEFEDFNHMFESFSSDLNKIIFSGIFQSLDYDCEELLILNPNLIDLLYISEIPLDLNFIRNNETKSKVWREITNNLKENYNKYFFDGILRIFHNLNNFKLESKGLKFPIYTFNIKKIYNIDYNCRLSIHHSFSDLIYADLGNILDFQKDVLNKRKKLIHFQFLFSNDQISNKIKENVKYQIFQEFYEEFATKFIPIVISLEEMKKIIFYAKIKDTLGIALDQAKEKTFVQNLFRNLKIKEKINDQLKILENRNFIIKKFNDGGSISSYRDFITQIYSLIDNEIYDPLKLYNNYLELDSLKVFGSKSKLLTHYDFSKSKFKNYIDISIENGFITKKENYLFYENPLPCKYIVNILNFFDNLSQLDNNLKIQTIIDNLIYLPSNDEYISVYLDILRHAGVINFNNNKKNVYLIDEQKKLLEKNILKWKSFKSDNKIFHEPKYHIYVKKARDQRLITLDHYMKIGLKYSNYMKKKEFSKQLSISLILSEIVDYFNGFILKPFKVYEDAFKNELMEFSDKIEQAIIKLEDKYDKLGELIEKIPKIQDLNEYKKLTEIREHIYSFQQKIKSQKLNELNDLIKKFDESEIDEEQMGLFNYQRFFNARKKEFELWEVGNVFLSYYKYRIKKNFDKKYEKINSSIRKLVHSIKSIKTYDISVKKRFKEIGLEKDCKISYSLFLKLKSETFRKIKSPDIDFRKSKALKEISMYVSDISVSLQTDIHSLDKKLKDMDLLREYEGNFRTSLNTYNNFNEVFNFAKKNLEKFPHINKNLKNFENLLIYYNDESLLYWNEIGTSYKWFKDNSFNYSFLELQKIINWFKSSFGPILRDFKEKIKNIDITQINESELILIRKNMKITENLLYQIKYRNYQSSLKKIISLIEDIQDFFKKYQALIYNPVDLLKIFIKEYGMDIKFDNINDIPAYIQSKNFFKEYSSEKLLKLIQKQKFIKYILEF